MVMNRIRIIGIFILTLAVIAPEAALADWKVYYTGKASGMFGSGGRGNFATRSQCEAYRNSSAGFERNNSYCSGFDTPSYSPPTPNRPSGDDGTAARENEKQRQLQLQREQKERELELARQKKFAEEKDQLLGTFKGHSTGTLGLKGANSGTLGLKTRYEKGTRDSAPVDLRVLQEQDEFAKMNAAWMKNQKQLIDQRLVEPNKYASAIYNSLKINAPPPLPPRKYEMLQPGDVLLFAPDDKKSFWINFGDRLSSASQSPASHTVLFLKEVNGKKLFLDHTSERGSHVISEEEFLKTYGHRDALVAQPVKEADTAAIWERTKELVKKEQEKQARNTESRTDYLRDKSGFGLYGSNNMVCSEADRWVLVNSGLKIPESASPLKRLLGIHYGPANFFSDDKNFIITPLYGVPK